MSQRFQIEDLVVQDNSGVVFRALDTQTGKQVALRRFFPFGGRGGGLDAEERIAYGVAVERFAGVSHPALRSVICGGCDPIDGMPFIATEWVEGMRLQTVIDRAPVAPDEAVKLLLQALEVCQFLSQSLKEQAVWIETDLQAIVIGAVGSGRETTFWVAPLRLLETRACLCTFGSIITLTEELTSWNGKTASEQVAVGLESWLKWLRGANPTTSLHEVREMLISRVGKKSSAPTKHLVHQTARLVTVSKRQKESPKILRMALGFFTLLAVGFGGWVLVKKNDATLAKAYVEAAPAVKTAVLVADIPPVESPEQNNLEITTTSAETSGSVTTHSISPEQASLRAGELLLAQQNSEREIHARRLEIQKRGGVFEVRDGKLLLEQKNAEVRLRGQVNDVQFSDKGKGATLYLEFANSDSRDGVRGFVMRKNLGGAMDLVALQKLVGKHILLRGKVGTPTSRTRPEIEIKDFDAIQEVK